MKNASATNLKNILVQFYVNNDVVVVKVVMHIIHALIEKWKAL